ncbi:MAG: helix-turn-helix domain-containing protein [Pseudonocardiaceae bacterium]
MAGFEAEYVRGWSHPALAECVLGYGGYREHSVMPLRRRQAPTGSCTLILGFGGPIRLHGPAGPTIPTSFLAGMHLDAVITEFTGHQQGVQVDLTPLGTFRLLRRPLPELTNRVARLDELAVPELAALPARLAEDTTWAARFARIDTALLGLLVAAAVRPDPEVAWAWGQLLRSGGNVSVRRLAEGTGWSRRHLLTRFRDQIGLAPKPAARVLRFRRAADLLVPGSGHGGGPGLPASRGIADVAAACGYADHAHLVRDFRALAGCTPSQYVAEWAP